MLLPCESVREQLLLAGVAPRHARRYVTELREHLADLTARERAEGHGAKEAAERARTLLGSDKQLAQEMIARGAPRSLAAKAPWAVFALLPTVMIVAVTALVTMIMFRLLMPVHNFAPTDMPAGYRALVTAAAISTSYFVGPLLAAACIFLALRQRLVTSWVWAGLVLIALFSGCFSFHPSTGNGDPYGAVTMVQVNGHISTAATFALIGMRATTFFLLSALTYLALKARRMKSPA